MSTDFSLLAVLLAMLSPFPYWGVLSRETQWYLYCDLRIIIYWVVLGTFPL